MTQRTIGCDGLDELPERKPHEQPVEYLMVMRVSLRPDQVYDIEENEVEFCAQVGAKIGATVKWLNMAVVE